MYKPSEHATFVQRLPQRCPNVMDVCTTLSRCSTDVVCSLGRWHINQSRKTVIPHNHGYNTIPHFESPCLLTNFPVILQIMKELLKKHFLVLTEARDHARPTSTFNVDCFGRHFDWLVVLGLTTL